MKHRKNTRRSRSTLLFVAAAGTLGLAACAAAPPRPETAAKAASSEPAAAPALEIFTSDAAGFDTHSYWLDTGSEVVVFDTQFTEALAEKLVAAIRAKTSSPIRWVVITHPNPDKLNGVRVFRKLGARVVASAKTAAAIPAVHAYKRHFFVEIAKMMPAAAYPPEPVIDVTFSGRHPPPLPTLAVELHELANPGVSSTQTVAVVPASRALVVGDLVHHRAHAWLEGGIVDKSPRPDIDGWIAALDEIAAYRGATVYAGRGERGPVEEVVPAQQAYLKKARDIVAAYVRALGPRVAELKTARAGEHHKALAAELSAAFPDHAHAYLVEYGVYGLVNQVAAEKQP